VQNICNHKPADKDQLKVHADSSATFVIIKSLEKGNLKRHKKSGHDGIKKFDTAFVIIKEAVLIKDI